MRRPIIETAPGPQAKTTLSQLWRKNHSLPLAAAKIRRRMARRSCVHCNMRLFHGVREREALIANLQRIPFPEGD
jgi:hypothetical protein